MTTESPTRQPHSMRRSVSTRTICGGRSERVGDDHVGVAAGGDERRNVDAHVVAARQKCGHQHGGAVDRVQARRRGDGPRTSTNAVRTRRPRASPTRPARSPIIATPSGLRVPWATRMGIMRRPPVVVDGQPVAALDHRRDDVLVAQRCSQPQHRRLDGVGVGRRYRAARAADRDATPRCRAAGPARGWSPCPRGRAP